MSRERLKNGSLGAALALLLIFAACAPQRQYRVPVPPSGSGPTPSRIPPPPPPPAPLPTPPAPPEAVLRPLPQEPKIREQDLKSKAPSGPPAARELGRQPGVGESRATPEASPPPLADDSALLAKITPGVTAQRAASLRLTDEGSKLLDAGDPAKALSRLERTIVIDATNPYGYFYLAKAQFRLGRYTESLNFLGVAESRLSGEPFWLAEVHALRGENYRAQGQLQRAEASYAQALRINSGNRTAADGLNRLQVESPSSSR